jgi:voltage-dependent potassium channel beta subunit
MNTRRLGRSGLKVSELSFGSWVTYGNQVDTRAARELMAAAFDAGVNFFDNAEIYAKGDSEVIMGKVLKELGWPRIKYVVSTKFYWGMRTCANDNNTLNRKYLLDAIDGSLKRLQLDYVDLVYCHRADPHTPIEETVWAMHNIIERGKALYWGTSEWTADEIRAAWDIADRRNLHKPVMEQPQYNLLHRRRVEQEYARLYEDIGLGLTTWSPLASGLLSGKYQKGIPPGSRGALESYAFLREGLTDRSGGQGSRLHTRPARAGVVRTQSARQHGDHRRYPRRTGQRKHEGARRRGETHARSDDAHRRHRRRRRRLRAGRSAPHACVVGRPDAVDELRVLADVAPGAEFDPGRAIRLRRDGSDHRDGTTRTGDQAGGRIRFAHADTLIGHRAQHRAVGAVIGARLRRWRVGHATGEGQEDREGACAHQSAAKKKCVHLTWNP